MTHNDPLWFLSVKTKKAATDAKAGSKDLSRADISLADKRADIVTDYLTSNRKYSEVEKLNMAKNENRIVKFFGSDEAEVKDAISTNKARKTWVGHEAKTITAQGGPGKVVVMVYDPEVALSH